MFEWSISPETNNPPNKRPFSPVDCVLYSSLCTQHSLSVHRGWLALMIYCWNICWTFKLTHRSHSRCGNMQYVIKMIPPYMQIKWPRCCWKGNKSEAIRIPSCGVTKLERVGCTYLAVSASHWKSSSCSSFKSLFCTSWLFCVTESSSSAHYMKNVIWIEHSPLHKAAKAILYWPCCLKQ